MFLCENSISNSRSISSPENVNVNVVGKFHSQTTCGRDMCVLGGHYLEVTGHLSVSLPHYVTHISIATLHTV